MLELFGDLWGVRRGARRSVLERMTLRLAAVGAPTCSRARPHMMRVPITAYVLTTYANDLFTATMIVSLLTYSTTP